ncbi:MAG: prepilin-type N-terminal cleavage/methylation domain-containing protein [Deltaproteobacteria bacterium]|nr:prepilin-type N-terminal cleavage/methylation domain-containing protein [Deltaproteobacteria bacterium]
MRRAQNGPTLLEMLTVIAIVTVGVSLCFWSTVSCGRGCNAEPGWLSYFLLGAVVVGVPWWVVVKIQSLAVWSFGLSMPGDHADTPEAERTWPLRSARELANRRAVRQALKATGARRERGSLSLVGDGAFSLSARRGELSSARVE